MASWIWPALYARLCKGLRGRDWPGFAGLAGLRRLCKGFGGSARPAFKRLRRLGAASTDCTAFKRLLSASWIWPGFAGLKRLGRDRRAGPSPLSKGFGGTDWPGFAHSWPACPGRADKLSRPPEKLLAQPVQAASPVQAA